VLQPDVSLSVRFVILFHTRTETRKKHSVIFMGRANAWPNGQDQRLKSTGHAKFTDKYLMRKIVPILNKNSFNNDRCHFNINKAFFVFSDFFQLYCYSIVYM